MEWETMSLENMTRGAFLAATAHRGVFNLFWMDRKTRDVNGDAGKMNKRIGGER